MTRQHYFWITIIDYTIQSEVSLIYSMCKTLLLALKFVKINKKMLQKHIETAVFQALIIIYYQLIYYTYYIKFIPRA
jgi:hypothetical protein